VNATKERQAWCCLQVKLCDPCLSALCVPWCEKALYKYSSFPFLSFPTVHSFVHLRSRRKSTDRAQAVLKHVKSKDKTSGRSSLTENRIAAAADGSVVVARWRQCALPCGHNWRQLAHAVELVLPSAHPNPQPQPKIDRFSHFCTAHGSVVG